MNAVTQRFPLRLQALLASKINEERAESAEDPSLADLLRMNARLLRAIAADEPTVRDDVQ